MRRSRRRPNDHTERGDKRVGRSLDIAGYRFTAPGILEFAWIGMGIDQQFVAGRGAPVDIALGRVNRMVQRRIIGPVGENCLSNRACSARRSAFRTHGAPGRCTTMQSHDISGHCNDSTGELAYYRCWSPHLVPLTTLVRVAGRRWTIEESFQAAKGQAGLDEHQVRTWTSWRRWVILSMLAMAFLAVTCANERDGVTTPARVDSVHSQRNSASLR